MPNLTTLCLNKTGIFNVSPSVGRLINLEVLSLDFNYISDLPISLEFCQKLSELTMTGNKFNLIPAVVLKLKNLKVLRISGNPLMQLAKDFNSPSPLYVDYWKWVDPFPNQKKAVFDIHSASLHLCYRCGRRLNSQSTLCHRAHY